jgi:2'-5' RNA ligase
MIFRYAVWIEIPPEVVDFLRGFYLRKTGKGISVRSVHLSILWPFFLNEKTDEKTIFDKFKSILVDSFEAKLLKFLVWEQKNKKILVVVVEPRERFKKIFNEVLAKLRDDIVFDKSVFSEGKLPEFLPHITIDYNFADSEDGGNEGELGKCFFTVDKMNLYREEERGKWIKV